MGTRTIRVTDEVYEQLSALKRPDESYSELLYRLADRDAGFERGFGRLADVDFEPAIAELDARFDEAIRDGP
ncbi:MAG: antitoxin VapB family protein [archaeon]